MIFGFPDVQTENTENAAKPVLEIIQEKPKIMEASTVFHKDHYRNSLIIKN